MMKKNRYQKRQVDEAENAAYHQVELQRLHQRQDEYEQRSRKRERRRLFLYLVTSEPAENIAGYILDVIKEVLYIVFL